MIIGILKEVKNEEYRVAVLPMGVQELCRHGHQVIVENNAGCGANYDNDAYAEAGATVLPNPAAVYDKADILVKVKEPLEQEFGNFRKGQTLFTYLHSETRPSLVDMLLEKELTAIAYENVRLADGSLPLLVPMSIIAGQQGVLQGMQYLCNHRNGMGLSLVAYPGVEPARVVVLGAGHAGVHAATVAAALGAQVALFELNPLRIKQLAATLPPSIRLLHSKTVSLESYVCQADMVVNTTTIPPNCANHLIDRKMVAKMRRGAVIVDIAANLHGAIETVDRYTTHNDPVWTVDGVVHYVVSNIPGTVAHTSSQALSMVVLPYLLELADQGPIAALKQNEALRQGLTAVAGKLTWHEAGEFQKRPWCTPDEAL